MAGVFLAARVRQTRVSSLPVSFFTKTAMVAAAVGAVDALAGVFTRAATIQEEASVDATEDDGAAVTALVPLKALGDDFVRQSAHSLTTALLVCAKEGALDHLKRLKSAAAVSGELHQAMLAVAAANDQVAVVAYLLAEGAKVDDVTTKGETALYLAAKAGAAGAVRALLNHGASCIQANARGATPLMAAVVGKHEPVVKLLLDQQSVHAKLPDETQAIHLAAQQGSASIASLLLTARANANALNEMNITPLHLAACCGHVDVVQVLLSAGAQVEATTLHQATPLHIALMHGHLTIAEMLIEAGANVEARNKNGATPLFVACHHGHFSIVKSLVSLGAKVNPGCHAPLTAACEAQRADIAWFLIRHGARIDHSTPTGVTCVHAAISSHADASLVDGLLQEGAPMDAQTLDGSTALHLAAQLGLTEHTLVLLSRGADVSLTNKALMTPLEVASQCGNISILKVMVEQGCCSYKTISPSHGWNILHVAVAHEQVAVVKFLLDLPTFEELNTITPDGLSPLQLAERFGFESVVRILSLPSEARKSKVAAEKTPEIEKKACTTAEVSVENNVVKDKST